MIENIINGIGATNVIAIGKAHVLKEKQESLNINDFSGIDEELSRLTDAVLKSKEQLEKVIVDSDETTTAILNAHINLLEDPCFIGESIEKIKSENICAEIAVENMSEELRQMFLSFDDSYMQERAADIVDVGKRIINNLGGTHCDSLQNLPPDTIIVSQDLVPSQTATMDKQNVKGFVIRAGSKTSHTAIMAKAMGIAAVVGCKDALDKICDGDILIIDGKKGEIIISPDDNTLSEYEHEIEIQKKKLEINEKAKNWVLKYKDGTSILVGANIGTLDEAKMAKENGADAVGLFRTEFLYMNRGEEPSEDEQYEIYKKVGQIFEGAPVIIRTLDIGGDKQLPYIDIDEEENPFMGMRAIRLCLKNKSIFKTQLRAILRASTSFNIKVMFPMIGSMSELLEAKQVLGECKKELSDENVPFNSNIEVGMMIEVPSAVIIADNLAKEVDFFSIGTNDLTQYTLAVDRGNESVSYLYDWMNPAVLKMIEMTINAAHENGILCCMCGEMAGDMDAIPVLAGYGLDEFSVSPGNIGETKNLLQTLPNIRKN